MLGQDVRRMRRSIKQRLGVVPQGDTLDTELTVEENLRSFGAYHGLARGSAQLRRMSCSPLCSLPVALTPVWEICLEECSGVCLSPGRW